MYQVINTDTLSKQQFHTNVELWKAMETMPHSDIAKLRLRRINPNGRWSRKYNLVEAVQNGVIQPLVDCKEKAPVN